MLALYRAGYKTEALEAFSRARGAMIQAFGTNPSPRLDALHIQILDDSPDLTGPLWPGALAGRMVRPTVPLLRHAAEATGPGIYPHDAH